MDTDETPQDLSQIEVLRWAGNFYERLATMNITVASARAVCNALADLLNVREQEPGTKDSPLARSQDELEKVREDELNDLVETLHELTAGQVIDPSECTWMETHLTEAFKSRAFRSRGVR